MKNKSVDHQTAKRCGLLNYQSKASMQNLCHNTCSLLIHMHTRALSNQPLDASLHVVLTTAHTLGIAEILTKPLVDSK